MKRANLLIWAALSVLTLGLAACGGNDPFNRSQDPYKEYPDHDPAVGKFVDPSKVPEKKEAEPVPEPVEQKYRPRAFDINAEKQVVAQRVLTFVAGEKKSYPIHVNIFHPDVPFKLVAHDKPADADLTPTKDPNVWMFTWSPKSDMVSQSEEGVESSFEIELVIGAGASADVQKIFKSEDRMTTFGLSVSKSVTQPSIEKISLDAGPYSEGDVVKFKVEVKDPSATKDLPPELYFSADSANQSNETQFLQTDLGLALDPSNMKPRKNNAGNWEFSCVYYTSFSSTFAREKNRKDAFEAQFYAIAFSQVNQKASVKATRVVKVKLAAPAEKKEKKS